MRESLRSNWKIDGIRRPRSLFAANSSLCFRSEPLVPMEELG